MLSVIIVNFRNASLLRLALRSLARAQDMALPLEVVVVDSASTPETRNVVRHDCANLFERITLVPFTENTGYTRGVNEGLKHATGSVLLILNPDIVISPGTLPHMVAYLREHPAVGLLGPGLRNFDGSRQHSWFTFYTPAMMLARRLHLPFGRRLLRRFLMLDTPVTGPTPVDWLMGSALMTTREALDTVGPMDERFFLYLSEVDWARRFWEHGYQVVYLPTAQMYHYHQRQSKGRFGVLDALVRRETRWHILDAVRYFRKNGTDGRRPNTDGPVQPRLLNAAT
jgi:hypothetical protein